MPPARGVHARVRIVPHPRFPKRYALVSALVLLFSVFSLLKLWPDSDLVFERRLGTTMAVCSATTTSTIKTTLW